MAFIVENKTYEFIVASDIIRDGLGIELWDKDNNKMIAEIFRNDKMKKIEFSCLECELPFETIELFIREFEKRVGREFQD